MPRKKPDKPELDNDEAAALWFMLRGAIACTGVSGQKIAEESKIGWPSLRQYASKARTPSRETFDRINKVLYRHGVTLDLRERTIHVHRSPKHVAGKDPRPKE